MFCEKCGKKIEDEAKFCPYCGNKFVSVAMVGRQPIKAQDLNDGFIQKSYSSEKGLIKKKGSKVSVIIFAIVVIIALIVGAVFVPGLLEGKKDKLEEKKDKEEKGFLFVDGNEVKDIDDIKEGNICKFGHYEQDNDTSNGKEEIEWIVLKKEDKRILVVSRLSLDYQAYNETYEEITWEMCTLRQWLNNDFFNSAFSDEEKDMIPTVDVPVIENVFCVGGRGNDTEDKVFLLDNVDGNRIFESNEERKCSPTEYARSKGADNYWWLRSNGIAQYTSEELMMDYPDGYIVYTKASYIDDSGCVKRKGTDVDYMYAVRPAMWIEIE